MLKDLHKSKLNSDFVKFESVDFLIGEMTTYKKEFTYTLKNTYSNSNIIAYITHSGYQMYINHAFIENGVARVEVWDGTNISSRKTYSRTYLKILIIGQ